MEILNPLWVVFPFLNFQKTIQNFHKIIQNFQKNAQNFQFNKLLIN